MNITTVSLGVPLLLSFTAGHVTCVRVQVTRVQRVENPELWERYSQCRQVLRRRLLLTSSSQGQAVCTPVERLAGSTGPVGTHTHVVRESRDNWGKLDQDVSMLAAMKI
jgi:hypothetical protein